MSPQPLGQNPRKNQLGYRVAPMGDRDKHLDSRISASFARLTGYEATQIPKISPMEGGDMQAKFDKADTISSHSDSMIVSMIEAILSGDTPYALAKKFENCGLSLELLDGLMFGKEFEKPSMIRTISLTLTPPHKQFIVQAHNGSRKTDRFDLGILSRVDPKLKAPQALCMYPTRELAIQVHSKMGKFTEITSELAIPAADPSSHIPISKRTHIMAQVVIGTPLTIWKLIMMKKLDMSQMKILVFDEADNMLTEVSLFQSQFRDLSVKIMTKIAEWNTNCQVLLFSATFNDPVQAFVSKIRDKFFPGEYNKLFVKKEELSLECVKQYKVHCPDEQSKVMVIKDRILELGEKVGQTIIFVNSKNIAAMLHKSLVEFGFWVSTIHGALKPEDRDKIIQEFKKGSIQVLISTDVLARGFYPKKVHLVVNFDLPVKYGTPSEPEYEVYLHRVGRAGHFDPKGVFNLINDNGHKIMAQIEEYFKTQIAEVTWNSEKEFEVALQNVGPP